jgi:fructose-bisphosphate aldolase class I
MRFAKWRAVIKIGKEIPSDYILSTNALNMSRYASTCQENGLVPIVEPEVLMDGNHTIEQCEQVTKDTLERIFNFLHKAHANFEMMLLKPNMVLPGKESSQKVSSQTVAEYTLSALSHTVPSAIPIIAFLSGGQSSVETTKNLNAICMERKKTDPWFLTFSFSRALQEEPLALWSGKNENKEKAQQVFLHRAKCNSSALEGHYSESIEFE